MTEENTQTSRFSRRQMLGALGTVGVVSAGAGYGTSAFLSDRTTFENNHITAGQLELSVTWQQLYHGASTDRRPDDYGSVGRPFVNAFPDENEDGLQSFGDRQYVDLDEYDDDDDGREQAAIDGENLEFSCEEVLNELGDPNEIVDGEPLINLDDVKPGDRGEITFGAKLCDNPGYIWLGGHVDDEFDGSALADAIQARVWYDDGNNVYEPGEPVIATGSLQEVLDQLREGELLTPEPGSVEPPENGNGVTLTEDDCEVVDGNPRCISLGLQTALEIDSSELEGLAEGDSETFDTDFGGTVTITVTAVSEDDVREFDFELNGFEVDTVIIKGGPNANVCSQEDGDGETLTASSGDGLGAPFRTDEQRFGVSAIRFCFDGEPTVVDPEDPGDEVCFEPSNTQFLGFEWELPADVGNDIQNESVKFDLKFYGEQCRHNPEPATPFGNN
ncbi:hypothetical protein [Natronocalculus amylovorans]|uniref:SipW-cognate class signal peptide n=1 Tax=Natronocalculus amylovorans TaxID=2917812 RepID=A0AAE3K986_9EURY|nr:hypothetical protein [Natronocalculus amylovorans]MCL9817813.1 hypothetical protein [Natronocalculus amylovorans]